MLATRRRRVTGRSLAALQIALLVAAAIGPLPVNTAFAAGNAAVQLNGSNQFVTFGDAAGTGELGASAFTLELWFKRTGAGRRDEHRHRRDRQRHPVDHEGSGRGARRRPT